MFLNELKQEQKNAFLEMAHLIANIDGVMVPEEEALLHSYESEMQMEKGSYHVKGISLDNILEEFTDDRSRRIAYVEILALAQVDSNICGQEQTMINEIEKAFAIEAQDKERFLSWLERVNQIYAEGSKLVYGN